MITAQLHHIDDVTPRLKTFWFSVAQPYSFTPGEYAEMYVEHDPDSRGEHRKFTISSSPADQYVGFTISFSTYGSSFKKALAALRPGDTVKISEPIGDFVLPKLLDIPVVGIAAGSGITPFMSMARDPQQHQREFSVTHIVRSTEDVVPVPARHFTYYVLPQKALSIFDIHSPKPLPTNTHYYLAGPEAIIQQFRDELLAKGISRNHIVTDLFIGAANL
jgi:ferredoxin-NADP reductase